MVSVKRQPTCRLPTCLRPNFRGHGPLERISEGCNHYKPLKTIQPFTMLRERCRRSVLTMPRDSYTMTGWSVACSSNLPILCISWTLGPFPRDGFRHAVLLWEDGNYLINPLAKSKFVKWTASICWLVVCTMLGGHWKRSLPNVEPVSINKVIFLTNSGMDT